jgi:hypothetical protein
MTRLNSIAEAGYFPTPPALLASIAAQVAPSAYAGGALLDMFCGQGEAAEALGRAWRLTTTGVEIHEERARAARGRLARVICGDAFTVLGTHDQFDACLHNPPYQYDAADQRWQRLEYKATLAVTPYLRPGGLLIAILPGRRLAGHARFAQFLATHYRIERVFRFPEPHYESYRQVVIYARKLAAPQGNAQAAQALVAQLTAGLPALPETCADPLPLPDRPIGKRAYFRGRELDYEAMLAEIAGFNWPGASGFSDLIMPREQERTGRPAMPYKRRHLAQLIAAAVMNNCVLRQGGVTHILCGRTRKVLTESEQLAANDEEDVETLVRQAFAIECLAFDPETGQFASFNQDDTAALRDYVQAWRQPLVEAVRAAFPPTYNFDFRETFPHWLVKYLDQQVAQQAKTPGRNQGGLFEGQKHATAAVITKLMESTGPGRERNYFILGAAARFGKTFVSAAVTGAFTRRWALETGHSFTAPDWRPSFIVTEPTLLQQTVEQYRQADPLLRPRIVRNVREVDQFLDDARTAPWPMVMVIPRTGAKDGFGWRPAIVPRRHGYFTEEGGERRLVVEALFACPECGALQREALKDAEPELWPLVRDRSYFEAERRSCHQCSAPLWQDYRQVSGKGYAVEFWECIQHWDADRDLCFGAPERWLQVNDLVCRTGRLETASADFKLQRGDEVYLTGDTLAVCRAGQLAATYDFAHHTLALAPAGSNFTLPPGARYWRVPGDRRRNLKPPMARLPVAEYLLRLSKRGRLINGQRERVRFVVGTIDELHKYKGHDTNAGYTLGNLVAVADKTLALTGTLYSGLASMMFYLEYRTNPQFRARWPYRGVRRFVARYGLLEWIERRRRESSHEDNTAGFSDLSGYRRRQERLRELPAISPELTALLLDHTLFLGLQDLGFEMVERTEHPVVVAPEPDFARAYQEFLNEARQALFETRERNLHLGGSVLQAMLSYSAAPWRVTEIRDQQTGRVWAWAPDLEIVCQHCGRTMFKDRHCARCHPNGVPPTCRASGCGLKQRRVFMKEQALLNNLLAAKANKRPALVLVSQTDTRDLVAPRWTGPEGLCASVGLRAVNGAAWVAAERARKLEEAVIGGADVVFINPHRIDVGLSLIQFPDLHHYQLDYSLLIVMQASARPWGPMQTQPVRVHYYCTQNTYEYRALVSLARKMYAALTLYGDATDSPLLEETGAAGDDLLHQIIADVAASEVVDLADLFTRYNQAAAESLRPGEYIGHSGFAVEQRAASDLLERRLEAALAPATPPPAGPLQQLSLFGL